MSERIRQLEETMRAVAPLPELVARIDERTQESSRRMISIDSKVDRLVDSMVRNGRDRA